MRILLMIGAATFVAVGIGLTVWLIVTDLRRHHRLELEKRQRMEWLGRYAFDVADLHFDPKWSEAELRARIRDKMDTFRGRGRADGVRSSDTEVLEKLAREARDIDPRRQS